MSEKKYRELKVIDAQVKVKYALGKLIKSRYTKAPMINKIASKLLSQAFPTGIELRQ